MHIVALTYHEYLPTAAATLFQNQKGLLPLKLAASDGIVEAALNLTGASEPTLLIRDVQIPVIPAVVESLPGRHRLGNLEAM